MSGISSPVKARKPEWRHYKENAYLFLNYDREFM